MDRSDQIDRALAGLTGIAPLHAQFLATLGTTKQTRTGTVSATGNSIDVVCFGLALTCVARPVVTEKLVAYEYAFFLPAAPEDAIAVAKVYLAEDGRLYSPLPEGSPVCDFNNSYVAERISDLVANGVLRSSAFSPRA